MKAKTNVAELRRLQRRVDALRKELGISPPGMVTFFAPCEGVSNEIVVVEADGFGGATTSVVEGNFPGDHFVKFERSFPNEYEAHAAAEDVAFNGISPSGILGQP